MTRWRLTPQAEKKLVDWRAGATLASQRRMTDVLETIDDGSWYLRWWNQPYPPDPSITEIRAGDGLIILTRLVNGEDPGTGWIDLVTITVVDDDEADLFGPGLKPD